MKILTISGSLRAQSSNAAILRAAAALAPDELNLISYEGLGQLPLFNPDLDNESPPEEVVKFRAALAFVDGVLISSPEYAHGVPGALKNALDWVVSSSGFGGAKPVALLNVAVGRGEWAQAQLTETLTVIEARMIYVASLPTGVVRKAINDKGEVSDVAVEKVILECLDAFVKLDRNTGEK